ncbi:hypothetical protein LO772_03395 [Yinghuangia sp. ASG 101]|uniref:hypothetical protein n=1 Tax=Yinghuangia sp. ASG 101 TaxID=2896848 RepID=UPI001E5F7829|nr:hypothetical protein [Yinghuangia sp. ASG 101]UGQ12677.1 hypothetical protein LO772_03395 [Yinghuangia sp. ASG 101]
MHDGIRGAVLMVRHLDADGVAEVVGRLVSSEGVEAVAREIARAPVPGDAFVSGVLASGLPELRRALAACPHLTTDQVRRVLRHGGPDVEVAARLFPNRRRDAAFSPVRPLPATSALSGPAAAEAALLDERCPDDLAQEVLARFPHLAHVLRTQHPGYARFLRGDHRPVNAITAQEVVRIGVHDGGLDLAEVVRHMRPARSALSALASVVGGMPWLSGELRALLGPRLARALRGDPGLWSELPRRLGSFQGSIGELLDGFDATDAGGGPAAADGVGDLCFLLSQLGDDQLADLLPELADETREGVALRAAVGDVPALTELAIARRDPHLLRGLARRTSIGPETTARLASLDDPAVNRALVANRDVAHAVRHRVFCGIPARAEGERLPCDPGLRDLADHAAPETLIACGDPELAARALAGRPRPRVADRVEVAIALWERGGGEFLGRVPAETFGASVGRLVAAAVTADSPRGLYEARARHAGKAAAATASGSGRSTGRRARDRAHDAWDTEWGRQLAATRALDDGHMTPDQMIHEVAPARHAVGAFEGRVLSPGFNPVDAVLAGHVRKHLDGGADRGAAWAVLVRLLPDFEGTLAELLTVCAAVAD